MFKVVKVVASLNCVGALTDVVPNLVHTRLTVVQIRISSTRAECEGSLVVNPHCTLLTYQLEVCANIGTCTHHTCMCIWL